MPKQIIPGLFALHVTAATKTAAIKGSRRLSWWYITARACNTFTTFRCGRLARSHFPRDITPHHLCHKGRVKWNKFRWDSSAQSGCDHLVLSGVRPTVSATWFHSRYPQVCFCSADFRAIVWLKTKGAVLSSSERKLTRSKGYIHVFWLETFCFGNIASVTNTNANIANILLFEV